LLNRSIICFGGEDWWYHHPHSKAHLMRKFARAGNKVIFVNSISMGLPGSGHKDLLPRIKRKLGSYSKLARQTDEGITVVSPASLTFFRHRCGTVDQSSFDWSSDQTTRPQPRSHETDSLDCHSHCRRHDRNV
jgi:hypothetical protein